MSQTTAKRSIRSLRIATYGATLALAGMGALGLSASSGVTAGATARYDTVKLVTHRGLGKILVNGAGRTLYVFTGDKPNQATCTAGCASVWPPLTIAKGSKLVAGPGLRHLGTIAAGNRRQVTWNKHPLYLYALDTGPRVVNGNGVKQGSAIWYAATSSRVDAKWPSSSSSTSPSPTSGGAPPATGYGY